MLRVSAPSALALTSLVALLAAIEVGCVASDAEAFGAAPSFAEVEQRLEAPTGELSVETAQAVFERFAEMRAATSSITLGGRASFDVGGSLAGIHSQALHLLGLAERGSSMAWRCGAIEHGDAAGTCACPDGGSFTYDFREVRSLRGARGAASAELKVRFEACREGETAATGSEFVQVTGGQRTSRSFDEVLVAADLALSGGERAGDLALFVRVLGSDVEAAVPLEGGAWVTVRPLGEDRSGAARFAVRDRVGDWTCSVASAHGGECARASGERLQFP